jgi:hypothetical protein
MGGWPCTTGIEEVMWAERVIILLVSDSGIIV